MDVNSLNKKEFELLMSKVKSIFAISTKDEQKALGDIMMKLKVQVLDEEKSLHRKEFKYDSFIKNDNVKKLRLLLEKTLNNINGTLSFKIGKINYSGNKASIALEAFVVDESIPVDETVLLKIDYVSLLPRYSYLGFTEAHFLKKFEFNSKPYEFVGFVPKARTYIYKGRSLIDGKLYNFGKSIQPLIVS